MKLFVTGRKLTMPALKNKLKEGDKNIWFHMASLGEYEQGLPIIQMMKRIFPEYKIVISFFSPSGYENKKNTEVADAVVYLPLDTPKNARNFIDLVNPELVFFVKYEFWPNYLKKLKNRQVRTFLISGRFRKNQLFFNWYGHWMAKSLGTFEHFFVQDNISRELLKRIGYKNVSISGDTRFDRVAEQLKKDNMLGFIEKFIGDNICLVAGSTWPEDEKWLEGFINSSKNVKIIVAPHNIHPEKIEKFRKNLSVKSVLYSEKDGKNLSDSRVFIMDTIGLLGKAYFYADIAYVGGAAGNTGLHNILEPATFGVPIVIGNHFDNFPEAKQLQKLAGLFSVSNSKELKSILDKLITDEKFRNQTGIIAGKFIDSNTGATRRIEEYFAPPNC